MKHDAVEYLQQSHKLSLRQACKIVNLNRSSYYYKATVMDDSEVIDVLNDLASKHTRNGFKKLYLRIRNAGYIWNHKKI